MLSRRDGEASQDAAAFHSEILRCAQDDGFAGFGVTSSYPCGSATAA
jgi:hypothetical protein